MCSATRSTPPLTDAVVQITGKTDHPMAIIGHVLRGIKGSNHPEFEQAFIDEVIAGDDANLMATCGRYVTIE